ncbi:MAG TPA: NADPH:quinone oxidoreductase family protein [Bryobacteraceae bacterium]|jgi:NADPH2:quinone reductase|nr:NADPH:quinone oxidoreductase family protein [Bryobacteraceae bacterium]
MRTWQVKNWCEPEGMEWAEVEIPEPKAGEVRVKNRASALNFFDILQIQGKYQIKPPFPFTPGAEISGEIDAVGEGVTGWKKGDRVLGFPGGSGFAEMTVLDAAKVFRIPAGMDWAQAAAMPIVYHTSYFALKDRAELRRGEWLLVHAGASGVGMSAIQIGKAFGARVIATAGSPEKLEFSRRQGADHVLDYTSDKWVDQVKEITGGRGADVIYDPVGGDVFDLSSKCIASFGRLLVIGFASGRIPSIAVNRILLKNMSVVGVFWGNHVKANPSYTAETQAALETLWNEKKINPEVSSTWPLTELPQAMQALADRKVLGKAVLLNAGT